MSDIVELIHATVRVEQPIGAGRSTVGTAFIVTSHLPSEPPRTMLVTANHVFANMPNDRAAIGIRRREAGGAWRYGPVRIRIRDVQGQPLWTRHPTQDVAVIPLPAALGADAIDASELPGARALAVLQVRPGDVMMTLGYPRGLSANKAGFPVLRAGRVASYPLSPASRYPTYMLDFNVFAGNSGGPVYTVRQQRAGDGQVRQTVVVTGILTQQVKASGERLAIGKVTQADFITETLELAASRAPTEVTPSGATSSDAALKTPGAAAPRNARQRLASAWRDFWQDGGVLIRRAWIVARDWALDVATRDSRHVPTN